MAKETNELMKELVSLEKIRITLCIQNKILRQIFKNAPHVETLGCIEKMCMQKPEDLIKEIEVDA